MNMNMNQKKKWEKENKLQLYTLKHIYFSFILQLHIFDKPFSMFTVDLWGKPNALCLQAVHKLLIHSAQVVQTLNNLPLRTLSKEAQEACSKICKYYHKHHTRKCSRKDSNYYLISIPCSKWPHKSSLRGKSSNEKI